MPTLLVRNFGLGLYLMLLIRKYKSQHDTGQEKGQAIQIIFGILGLNSTRKSGIPCSLLLTRVSEGTKRAVIFSRWLSTIKGNISAHDANITKTICRTTQLICLLNFNLFTVYIGELLFVYGSAFKWFIHSLEKVKPVRLIKIISRHIIGPQPSIEINGQTIKCILLPSPLNRGRKGETLEYKLAFYRRSILG